MKMSYDRIGNHRIRENGKKISIFIKIENIKRDIKTLIPEIEDNRILNMMSHCRRYYEGKLHYGRRDSNTKRPRDLTNNERIIYDYLLREGYNPSTTYRWFLATRLPSDIMKQLAKGKIGQKLAMKISANRRRTKESVTGLLMMEEIRSVIEKLDWRG